MTHTYTISGMTCGNCVAKVKSELLKNPDIAAADVTLEPQQAVISMNRHLSIDNLQSAVSKAGNYKISESPRLASGTKSLSDSVSTDWFTTYKPIVLIFVFITGISLVTAYRSGSAGIMHFMNAFMAGFFLVFSFFKFLDLKGFADSYSTYDWLAMRSKSYAFVYPFIELALGLAYLTGIEMTVTYWATVIVMGFSSLGVIRSVLRKEKIQCACLGAVFNLPMSTVTIIEDLLMVFMAAGMLIFTA